MSRQSTSSADHWDSSAALYTASPFWAGGWFNTTIGQSRKYLTFSVGTDINNMFSGGQSTSAANGHGSANSFHGGTNSENNTGNALAASTWQWSSFAWSGNSPSITETVRLAGVQASKGSGGGVTAPTGTISKFGISGRPSDHTSGIGGGVAHVSAGSGVLTDLMDSYMAGGGNPRAIGAGHYYYVNTASGTEPDRIGSIDLTITGSSSFGSNPDVSTWWTAVAQADQSATQGSTFPAIDLTTKFEDVQAPYTCTLKQVGSAGTATTAVGAAASPSQELTVASVSGIVAGSWVSIAGGAKNFVLFVSGSTLLLLTAQTWNNSDSVTPYAASTPTGLTTNGYTITANVTGGTVGAGAVGTYSNCYYLATNNNNAAIFAPSALHTITVASSGAAASFTTGPTLVNATTDGYNFFGASNQTAAWYTCILLKGSPSLVGSPASVRTGSPTGFVSRFNTTITGSGATQIVSGLTLPLYDVYHVLNNVNGDSAVTANTALFKTPPVGKQYTSLVIKTISAITKANPAAVTATAHGRSTGDSVEIGFVAGMTQINGAFTTITKVDNDHFTLDGINSTGYSTYTSGGILTWGQSSLYGASAQPVTGDVGVCDAVDPQGAPVTLRDDGVTVYTTSSLARQSVSVDFYDVSAGAMVGAATQYMNDQPPQAPSPTDLLPAIVIPLNLLFSINLASALSVVDPQGDTLQGAALTSLPSGLSVTSGILGGTSNVESQTTVTFSFPNNAGETIQMDANLLIGNLTVPNLLSLDRSTAEQLLRQGYFLLTDPAIQDDPNPIPAAVNTVLAQLPLAGTKVAPGSPVVLSLSSGVSAFVSAPAAIPDVSSAPTDQATATASLTTAGFVVNVPQAWTGTVKITQSPTAGSVVPRGSVVSLFLPGGANPPKRRHAPKKRVVPTQKPRTRIIVKVPGKR